MNDGMRNSTDEERARLAAGQHNAACVHNRIKANCIECSAPEMLALLRDIEWTDDISPDCPKCRAAHPVHRVDCPLAALLARFPEGT